MVDVYDFAEQNNIDIIKIVDITSLTLIENKGLSRAILLVKILPKDYIHKLNRENNRDSSIFSETDKLADKLTESILQEGYKAISQSEKSIDLREEYNENTKSTFLPHKKIAVMSGLGWIGKNNLLITQKYGAALSMCSVLTDMPLNVDQIKIIASQCGECNLCAKICPVQAIHGKKWELGINRDDIVDVYKCITCLKCLAGCKYSINYSKS